MHRADLFQRRCVTKDKHWSVIDAPIITRFDSGVVRLAEHNEFQTTVFAFYVLEGGFIASTLVINISIELPGLAFLSKTSGQDSTVVSYA